MKVYAQEEANSQQDYSYLLNDEAIIGQTETNPSGVYLLNGMSTIQDAGTGKIIAGGITNGAIKCDLTVNVIVERLSGGEWCVSLLGQRAKTMLGQLVPAKHSASAADITIV